MNVSHLHLCTYAPPRIALGTRHVVGSVEEVEFDISR